MSSSRGIKAIRRIVQNLRTNIDLIGGDSSKPTRTFVLQKARTADGKVAALAENYAQLLADLKERKRLQTLDTGAEVQLGPKEMSRRAAARAGLQLPDLNPDLEK